MKQIKFLHCADVHLDAPFTSLGAGNDKSAARRQDLKDTFYNIIKTAREHKVDLLLISGDLYEHNYVKKSTINFIKDRFSEIEDIHIFLIAGNHDPYISNSYYRNFDWGVNVHILSPESPRVCLEQLGADIYGTGFTSFYEDGSHESGLKPVDTERINLLLAHGTVDMSIGLNSYNPLTSASLAASGMDYIAMGHFHNRIDDIGGRGLVYNPGSPEPLGFDEAGEHGVYIGTITKQDNGAKILEIDFLVLNRRFYENAEINVDGCNNDEQIVSRVETAIEPVISCLGKEKCMLSITLKGYVESGFRIGIQQVQARLGVNAFFIKIKDETGIDYNFEELKNEPGLRGLFTGKMLTLLHGTEDEHEKARLLKALYYGLEALERGKVDVN